MRQQKGIVILLLLTLICTACSNSEENNHPTQKDTFSEAVSTLEEGGMKKIGDTVNWRSSDDTDMEYTVQKLEIFDHYTDSGIPESEFCFGLNDNKFVMLDVKVKKISGSERQNEDYDDNISYLYLINKRILEEETRTSARLPEMCYFSGHVGDNEKRYGYYWLDPGEEAVFQVGWCLTGMLTDTEELVLNISNNLVGGEYIDLTT